MTSSLPDRPCEAFHEDLAAAACGTLSGRRRAEAFDHLERCPTSAADLDGLSAIVDVLMSLVPDADPPPSLADRTIDRMRADADGGRGTTEAATSVALAGGPGWRATGRRRGSRAILRPALAAAAIVVALVAGVVVGDAVAPRGGGLPVASARDGIAATPGVRTAVLRSVSGAHGTVVLVPGRPGWLVMTVDDAHAWGTINCQVATASGSRHLVASYSMRSAYGSWTARLPVPASSVRSVWLSDDAGTTFASARLPTR